MTVPAASVSVRSLRRLHVHAGEAKFELDVCYPSAYAYEGSRATAHLTRVEDDFVRMFDAQAMPARSVAALEVKGTSYRDTRSLATNVYAANFADGSLTPLLTYLPQSTTEALLTVTVHAHQGAGAPRAKKRGRQHEDRVRQCCPPLPAALTAATGSHR